MIQFMKPKVDNKLHFISLGCPKNLVDSEVMLAKLIERGFTLTDDPYDAGVIVVNTCAFIEDAKSEAIDTILEMSEFKKNGTCKMLVVTGCMPQRYKGELSKLLPEVDVFIGAGDFSKIDKIISSFCGEQIVEVNKSKYLYDHETSRLHTTPKHIGYIKIAEGCFHPCSFCVIPKIRGTYRSRDLGSVVSEAKKMISNGVKEINLIAQDSTSYGRDNKSNIVKLMKKLSTLSGEKWIRLFYVYPHNFPDALLDVIADSGDICKYIDMPIQHINDKILKSMQRKGDSSEIKKLIEKMRRKIPNISIRTSLIVGYPGETKRDFDELVKFVCDTRFDHLGVFIYSPEEGTKAFGLKNKIPNKIAKERKNEIMELQKMISQKNNEKFVGKKLKVLIDGSEARHEGQALDIDGVVYINEGVAKSAEFATVEITDVHEYDLVGRVV